MKKLNYVRFGERAEQLMSALLTVRPRITALFKYWAIMCILWHHTTTIDAYE